MRLAFQINPGITIYLQNNGNWYGERLSSSILSCNFTREEGLNRLKKLSHFLLVSKKDKPIKWRDVIDRNSLFDEDYENEQAGELIRDNCKEISSVELNGGYLFGGVDSVKYVTVPSIETRNAVDQKAKWTRPVITMTCKFTDKHECKIDLHKDNMDKLLKTQDIIQKTFLREEIKNWNSNPSKKSPMIVQKAQLLLTDLKNNEKLL